MTCHNVAVTVERDVHPASSKSHARDVSGKKQQASQSAGSLTFCEVHRMTGATQAQAADCGKPTRPQTIREFERSLLTLGFSQREAKAVASGGFKATFPTNELGEQLDALAEAVARCQTILKG